MKNKDKIKNMTNEEMKQFIYSLTKNCDPDFCDGCVFDYSPLFCKSLKDIEQWLESEAE